MWCTRNAQTMIISCLFTLVYVAFSTLHPAPDHDHTNGYAAEEETIHNYHKVQQMKCGSCDSLTFDTWILNKWSLDLYI